MSCFFFVFLHSSSPLTIHSYHEDCSHPRGQDHQQAHFRVHRRLCGTYHTLHAFRDVGDTRTENTKSLTFAQQKEREGELILRQIQDGDHVVLLDEHGKERRSIDFASWLEKKSQNVRRLVFVIGGAYGFADSVYQRGNEKVSLSQMTFSHQMVRMIFVEQVYRACTIIKGEPYHNE